CRIGEPRYQSRAVNTVIRPVGGDERLAELAEGRLVAFADVLFFQNDAHALPVLVFAEGVRALFIAADSPRRLLRHLDLSLHDRDRSAPPARGPSRPRCARCGSARARARSCGEWGSR